MAIKLEKPIVNRNLNHLYLNIIFAIMFVCITSVSLQVAQSREVRVISINGVAGQNVTVPVELVAQGNEAAIGFTLTFDPAVLTGPVAAVGDGAPGALLLFNSNEATNGRLGISLAMPIGQTIQAGVRRILNLTFSVSATAPVGATPVGFSDQIAKREVSDGDANVVQATFTQGAVTVVQQNLLPTLTSISPATVFAQDDAFTITVTGTNFLSNSVVRFNGNQRSTTFVSSTQLTAQIQASDIAVVGPAVITVQTPAPGGGVSNEIPLAINNPIPTIGSLSPNSVTTGTNGATITVNGTKFVAASKILWKGEERPTTFANNTQLILQLPASDLAKPGTSAISAFNPAPGGGTSNTVNFEIANPAPAITSLSPNSVAVNGQAFTLAVTGSNFLSNSVIRWNDVDRPTTYISGTQLRADISAADLTSPSVVNVKVFTPAPGGGETNALPFTIYGALTSVSAASFTGEQIATDSIVAAFGTGLATRVESSTSVPLPTELAGTMMKVKDSTGSERLAPLFFVAPTQINYQLPPGSATGSATVTVTSGDNKTSLGTVQVATVAPGLFAANANGLGVAAATLLRVKLDGAQIFEPIARFDMGENKFVAIPIDLGPQEVQVFLVVFGCGFRFRSTLSATTAKLGGTDAEVLFAGETPGLIGLDQSNIRIPRSLAGRGEIDLLLTVDGKTANIVKVNIK